ncbi:hypothetical protein [Paraliobacillus sp. X-1268]|nr:hypothetical protein [Paraliobacillus sp. X-1268]
MYEVASQTPKEVFLIYIVFLGACLITYPIIKLITTTLKKGLS